MGTILALSLTRFDTHTKSKSSSASSEDEAREHQTSLKGFRAAQLWGEAWQCLAKLRMGSTLSTSDPTPTKLPQSSTGKMQNDA